MLYFGINYSQISHGEFWNRYLFRKALLEDEEAEKHRRRSLEKKVCESLEWEKGIIRYFYANFYRCLDHL